ncbi:conserved protein of unknown function [Burkholderia multivorans]
MAEKPIIYTYHSPFGLMTIRQTPGENPRWLLAHDVRRTSANGEVILEQFALSKTYPNAEAVADAVLMQETGWSFWDNLPFVSFPASLGDWMPVDAFGGAPPTVS